MPKGTGEGLLSARTRGEYLVAAIVGRAIADQRLFRRDRPSASAAPGNFQAMPSACISRTRINFPGSDWPDDLSSRRKRSQIGWKCTAECGLSRPPAVMDWQADATLLLNRGRRGAPHSLGRARPSHEVRRSAGATGERPFEVRTPAGATRETDYKIIERLLRATFRISLGAPCVPGASPMSFRPQR